MTAPARAVRACSLALAGVLALVACESSDVIVADQRAAAGAAGAAGAPSVEGECAGLADCELDELCAGDCSGALGVCERRPITCPPEPAPVCGCDGVTYWNDCLRRQVGVRGATPGECVKGPRCGRPGDPACPPGAVCARVLPPMVACTEDAPGACWLVPQMCPKEEPAAKVFSPCGPGPGPMPMCWNACEALRSGVVVRRSPGPCMP